MRLMLFTVFVVMVPIVSFGAETVSENARIKICAGMLSKIESAALDVQSAEVLKRKFGKDANQEANELKYLELIKKIEKYESNVVTGIAHLADLLTIYKSINCNVDAAAIRIYCPDPRDRQCNWVYQSGNN